MSELEFIAQALNDADAAVAVLSTMLASGGLRQGFVVADEIAGNIKTARKHVAHLIGEPCLQITREQFDVEALAYANKLNEDLGIRTAHTLLTDARIGYARLPAHLKADLHERLGVEPVQMFKRVCSVPQNKGNES